MPTEVIMPKVDMDMEAGTVIQWHVDEGGAVEKGAPLFDIETDKAAMEVEAEVAGRLHHRVAEGTSVPIGQPIAYIFAPDETVTDAPTMAETVVAPAKPEETPVSEPVLDLEGESDGLRATPKARSLAREAALALDEISGTGPKGRIQSADVEALLADSAPSEAETAPAAPPQIRQGTGIPLVLIHGFASDHASWAPMEATLPGRTLIRLGLPGHGGGSIQTIGSFADLARHVRDAFDALDIETAHLIGHSLGGALALALADTRPRRVASLNLIAPAGLGPDVNGSALQGLTRATKAESLAPWLRKLVYDDTMVTEKYARMAMAARADAAMRADQQRLGEVLFPDGTQSFDLRAALDRVTMPTALIWGKADEIVPWQHALQAPGTVALHLLDRVGHIPQIEQAEVVGKILASRL